MKLYGESVRADPPVLGEPKKKRAEGAAAVSACVRWAYAISMRRDASAEDTDRAYAIYVATCDAGNEVACTNEGIALENGSGVARDEAAAMQIYRRTCDAGHPRACALWGERALRDGGVTEGRAALEYACDAGDPTACPMVHWLHDAAH